MAKLKKRLRQLVNKMVINSLNKDGSINNSKASSVIRSLKKLPHSQAILSLLEFSKGVKRQINKTTLIVESSVKLSQAVQKQVIKSLTADYLISRSQFITNSSLIGGLRVKIGDTLIDDSVKARADQLKERIIHG